MASEYEYLRDIFNSVVQGGRYTSEDPIYHNRDFMSHLYGLDQNAPGFVRDISESRDARGLFNRLYSLYGEGVRGRDAMSVMAANYSGNAVGQNIPQLPAMTDMLAELRYKYQRMPDGSYRFLPGQELVEGRVYFKKINGENQMLRTKPRLAIEPFSEASQFVSDRAARNYISTLSPAKKYETPDYTTPVFDFSGSGGRFEGETYRYNRILPNGVRNGKDLPLAARDKKGQYARKNTVIFDLNTDQDIQYGVGYKVRELILKNFDNSGIHNISGTLRKSIEQADVVPKVGDNGKSLKITVTLKDLMRPARPGRDMAYNHSDGSEFNPDELTTGFYGPMVFEGRRAIIAPDSEHMMRFFSGNAFDYNESFGGWHTTRSVTASTPHPEVFQLTKEQIAEIGAYMFKLISDTLVIKDAEHMSQKGASDAV